jgi:hypothetical protein
VEFGGLARYLTMLEDDGSPGFAFAWEIVQDDVGSDVISSDGSGKAATLRDWLYGNADSAGSEAGDRHCGCRCRYAPSIILRSEAELFGVSSPRFAVRLFLNEKSFVNCRRRRQLAGEILLCHGERLLSEGLPAGLEDDNWIADSLLEPPLDLRREGFRFLTVDLSAAYGERESFDGVPFVTFIRHGGLCAQASCFMVMAVLHGLVYPIGGVADVTVLAKREQLAAGISREDLGLNPEQIVNLFQNDLDGLTSHFEVAGYPRHEAFPTDVTNVDLALKSYLSSGFPVIALVSLSRMFGYQQIHGATAEPILIAREDRWEFGLRNQIPFRGFRPNGREEETKEPHMVVVVGWNPASDEFILNDPATYPFIPVKARQLVDARQYLPDAIDGELKEDDLAGFGMLTFAPQAVRLPLLRFSNPRGDGEQDELPGLFALAQHVQSAPDVASPLGLKYGFDHRVSRPMRLVGINPRTATLGVLAEEADDQAAARLAATNLPANWYWVQYIPEADEAKKTSSSLWFWKAFDYLIEPPIRLVACVLTKAEPSALWQPSHKDV